MTECKVIKASRNGKITTLVNGVKHLYEIDSNYISMVRTLSKESPDKLLRFLTEASGHKVNREEEKIVDGILALWND